MAHTLRIELSTSHNPAATPVDGQFPISLIRKQLSASELVPANTRWNPSTATVQITLDGGLTWVDAPESDPRTADAYRYPPAGSGSTYRCDVATRIVTRYQNVLSSFFSAIALSAAATGILQILLLLTGGAGLLIDLVFAVLAEFALIGEANIAAAMTPTVWNDLRCIIYCYLSDDGQLTQTDADNILADFAVLHPGVPYNVLVELQTLFGPVLMSNAGSEGTEVGNCTGCPSCSWAFCADLTALWAQSYPANTPNNGSTSPAVLNRPPQGALGTISGHGVWSWEKTLGDGALRFGRTFRIDIPPGATLTEIRVWFARSAGNTDQFAKVFWPQGGTQNTVVGAFHNSPLVYAVSLTGTQFIYLGIGSNVASDPGTGEIRQIKFTGTGTHPDIASTPQWVFP